MTLQRDAEPTDHQTRSPALLVAEKESRDDSPSPSDVLLRYQQQAGNAALSKTMVPRVGGHDPAPPDLTRVQRAVTVSRKADTSADAITPASIKSSIESVNVVDKTSTEMLLRPYEMFALVPANTPAKAAAYRAVQKAVRRLHKAEEQVANATATRKPRKIAAATTKFEAAQKALEASVLSVKAFILSRLEAGDADMKRLTKAEKSAKRKLDALSKPAGKALSDDQRDSRDTKVAALTAELAKTRADLAARHTALSGQVEGGRYGPQSTERHYYAITVDGETIKMHDHVEAYATTAADGVDGMASGESKGDVASVVDATALSASRKKILKVISEAEGGFTSVNTWDRATLTWGFVQWTGGDHTDLTAALTIIKRVAPDAFTQRFAKYGIDVVDNKLVVTGDDGGVTRGEAAARAVQGSPLLTAIMSRAGMDPEIQKAQVQAADEYEIQRPLDQSLKIKFATPGAAGGRKTTEKVKLGSVLTSEYAVGIIADQTVHGGMGSFLGKVTTAVQKFVDAKGVAAADVSTWASDAEAKVLKAAIQWADRAKAMEKGGCSKAAGSFS